jgi:hypothetical protein
MQTVVFKGGLCLLNKMIMTDKVYKIRKKVVWLQKRALHNFDISLTENERQFWLGESNVLTLIGKYIDSLPEEPHQELYDKLSKLRDDALSNETKDSWEACLSEEPVSEGLEEAAENYAATDEVLPNGKVMINFQVEKAFRVGANWQKANLWKPANGDDLPEYDREVIAILDYDFGHYKVVYAHRPNPNGWNGTNIDTGEKEHFEPEIYDKGCWNQPHVLYWLDTTLPYEENKIDKEIEL